MADETAAKRRPPRRQQPPPPPPPLLEFDVLKQFENPLGLTFWKALRDVRTWTEVEPADRRLYFRPLSSEMRECFAYARHTAPELESAFTTFALLVQAPEVIEATQIAAACDTVYKWADERGMALTALYFAEVGAYVMPSDPARANQAARTARRNVMRNRAAIWHLRAYRLGQRSGNTKELIWALLGYGAMMRDAGNFEEARRFIERAARRAVGSRRCKEAGMAYHDLYVIAVELERYALALKHARNAFNRYPVHNPSIPRLAHDLSFLFIRLRQFPSAVTILTKAIPLMLQPVERAIAWSSLAWAAGGAGLRERFSEAERTALALVPDHPDYAPAIFIHLAEGARAVREWDRARRYASAAQESAQANESPALADEAAALLASVEAREPPLPQAEEDDEVASLSRLVLARLGRWRSAPGQ